MIRFIIKMGDILMKLKLISFLTAVVMTVTALFSSIYADTEVTVVLNGKKLLCGQQPVIIDGSVYTPMRDIFEAYGFEVEWNPSNKRIKAIKEDESYIMLLQTGSKTVNICGKVMEIDKAPIIINGAAFLPLRAVSESLDSDVKWDSNEKKVVITRNNDSITVQTSKNFSFVNYADKDFWGNDNWEEMAEDNTGGYANSAQDFLENNYNDEDEAEDEDDEYLYGEQEYYDWLNEKHKKHHRDDALNSSGNHKDYWDSDNDEGYDDEITGQPESYERAYERKVLTLVNEEREKENLSPLVWNEELAKLAREHSEDMEKRDFFSHINPDGLDPFDRMSKKGIKYSVAAENIAYGQQTPEAVMNTWMNSEGHRKNIMNPQLKELGVGAVKSEGYGYLWTQCFIAL